MKKYCMLNVIFFCVVTIAQPQAVTHISPSNANIDYVGRFDFSNKEKPVFMYSGTALRIAFMGTSVSVLLQDDSLRNWFTVKLDDSLFIFKADKKEGDYSPSSGHSKCSTAFSQKFKS